MQHMGTFERKALGSLLRLLCCARRRQRTRPQLLSDSRRVGAMDPAQIDFGAAAPLGAWFSEVAPPELAPASEATTLAMQPAQEDADGEPAGEGDVGLSGIDSSAEGAQIDLGEPIVLPEEPKQKYVRYSRQHMDRMRDAGRLAKAKAKASAAQKSLAEVTGAFKVVCTVLPDVAKLVNAPAVSHIGRKRCPQPEDFLLLVRALHLPSNSSVNLGIRLDRLQCAGANLVMERQERGLQFVLESVRCALAVQGAGRIAHLSCAHLWDEVEVAFQWGPPGAGGISRKGTLVPTLVQRGVINVALRQDSSPDTVFVAEHWLGPPMEVCGTSASALVNGLVKFWPKVLNFLSAGDLQRLTSIGLTYT